MGWRTALLLAASCLSARTEDPDTSDWEELDNILNEPQSGGGSDAKPPDPPPPKPPQIIFLASAEEFDSKDREDGPMFVGKGSGLPPL